MKQYNITLKYQEPNRDDYGFPRFGEKIVEILSTNIQYVHHKLDEMFGKDNYAITHIHESTIDKHDLTR